MATAQSNITTLQGKVATAESDIDTLENGMSAANSAISGLQSSMATAQSNIGTLQTDMSTANGNITNLQTGLATANNNITAVDTKYETEEITLTSANSTFSTTNGSVVTGNCIVRLVIRKSDGMVLDCPYARIVVSGCSARPKVTVTSDILLRVREFMISCSTVMGPSSAPGTQYPCDTGIFDHINNSNTTSFLCYNYASNFRTGYFEFTR